MLNHFRVAKSIAAFICYMLFFMQIQAQTTYVFFGSYNRDSNAEGIYIYSLDSNTGKLTKIATNNSVSNPSFLSISPNGKFIYACTESLTKNAGSVSSYAFDAGIGALRFINTQKSGGENPVYVSISANGKHLINANYTESSISVFSLSKEGNIDSVKQLLRFSDSSIHPLRQDRSHMHAAVFSPDQSHILFPDLGADKIRVFAFDSMRMQPLKEEYHLKTTPGGGPRHIVFHPNGKFVYCIEELAGAISLYKYENGKLDSIQRVFTHPENYTGRVMSSDIHISPDGKFVYASNRGDQNNLSIFAVQDDGTLVAIGYQSSFGIHPRVFDIDPSGRFLIVTNLISGNVIVFRRNNKTGALKKIGKGKRISNVSFVCIRQY